MTFLHRHLVTLLPGLCVTLTMVTDSLLDSVTLLLVRGVTLPLRDGVTNIPRDLVTSLRRLIVTEEVTDGEALLVSGDLQSRLADLIRNILADDIRHGDTLILRQGRATCGLDRNTHLGRVIRMNE